jgi:hypothetical protein
VAAMIENEQQYCVTKAQIQRFEETLVNFANDAEGKRQENPLLFEVQVSALESQLADLREELAEYEAHTIDKQLTKTSISESISEKARTFEEVIQNIGDKITFTNLISTSLIIGGLIFLAYFSSIGYLPELEINSVATLLGASAITGGFIYGLISFVLISPGIIYGISINSNKDLRKILIIDHQGKTIGFVRLSMAMFIFTIAVTVTFKTGNESPWIFYKALIGLTSIMFEFFILKSIIKIVKNKIKFFDIISILLLIVLSCVLFLLSYSLTLAAILVDSVAFSENINHNPNLDLYRNLPALLAIIVIIYIIIVLFNKFVSLEAEYNRSVSKSISKIVKYLVLALSGIIFSTAALGHSTFIPRKIFEIYGWRNVKNASLVVNYEGCQTLKEIEIKIVNEQCVKTKNYYHIDDLQILSTIGKNYFLRYPKVHLGKKNNSKPMPKKNSSKSKNNPKQMAKNNSPKSKNSSKPEATQPERFVDFTLPASSVRSWSRK